MSSNHLNSCVMHSTTCMIFLDQLSKYWTLRIDSAPWNESVERLSKTVNILTYNSLTSCLNTRPTKHKSGVLTHRPPHSFHAVFNAMWQSSWTLTWGGFNPCGSNDKLSSVALYAEPGLSSNIQVILKCFIMVFL